jgi:hypothetical protein
MRRRDFIAALGVGVLWPPVAAADLGLNAQPGGKQLHHQSQVRKGVFRQHRPLGDLQGRSQIPLRFVEIRRGRMRGGGLPQFEMEKPHGGVRQALPRRGGR